MSTDDIDRGIRTRAQQVTAVRRCPFGEELVSYAGDPQLLPETRRWTIRSSRSGRACSTWGPTGCRVFA